MVILLHNTAKLPSKASTNLGAIHRSLFHEFQTKILEERQRRQYLALNHRHDASMLSWRSVEHENTGGDYWWRTFRAAA